jgi:ribosomal protein S18 acetylase RimI-like enzyme
MAIEILKTPTPAQRDALHGLLRDAVDHGASVGYVLPLPDAQVADFWQNAFDEAARGERVLLIAVENGGIAGSVQLSLCGKPNGAHRAEVQKLLVHSAHRRKGIARQLMTAIEREARALSRMLLVLDTESGSVADRLYEKLGYRRIGTVPRYAATPDGALKDCAFFYRELGA